MSDSIYFVVVNAINDQAVGERSLPIMHFCFWLLIIRSLHIMITCPCNVDPLTPHFSIVKFGFTGVYIILLFCSKTYIVGTSKNRVAVLKCTHNLY